MVTIIAHKETGNVITVSPKNPGEGIIRVDSTNEVIANGYMVENKRTAFFRGKVELLESKGFVAGQQLKGHIYKMESFEPFWATQNPKINPKTGEVVYTDGKPTYLQFVYDPTGLIQDYWKGSREVAAVANTALTAQQM